MKKVLGVCGALVASLAVAVPLGAAGDGRRAGDAPGVRPMVTCGRVVVGGRITSVGADAILLRPGRSESGRSYQLGINADTVVKQGDLAVDRSALVAGTRVRVLVRLCRTGDGREATARVISLVTNGERGGRTEPKDPPTTGDPPKTEPKPAPETCGQGETDAVLVAISATALTVRTTSAEGTKEWPVAVTGDTIVRKGDQTVSLAALGVGDVVHVVVVRCPSGSVRALRVVFVRAAEPVVTQ